MGYLALEGSAESFGLGMTAQGMKLFLEAASLQAVTKTPTQQQKRRSISRCLKAWRQKIPTKMFKVLSMTLFLMSAILLYNINTATARHSVTERVTRFELLSTGWLLLAVLVSGRPSYTSRSCLELASLRLSPETAAGTGSDWKFQLSRKVVKYAICLADCSGP